MFEKQNLTNPFQRRIARHANLATLFRQPSAAPGPSPGPAPGPLQAEAPGLEDPSKSLTGGESSRTTGVELVKARLLPAESKLPQAILLPRLPVEPAGSTDWETPEIPTHEPGISPAEIQTAPQPVSSPPSEPKTTEGQSTGSHSRSSAEEEDPTWRRLQTIYRRHQERQLAEQDQGEISLPDNAPSDPTDSDPSTSAQSPPVPGSDPVVHPTSRETEASADQSEKKIQRQVAQAPQESYLSGPQDQVSTPAEAQADQTEAQLPLEAVWPVQRADQPVTSEMTSTASEESPAGSNLPASSRPAPEGGQPASPPQRSAVRSSVPELPGHPLEQLQHPKPGRPSTSSIEVIPPRRPHPMRPDPLPPIEAAPELPIQTESAAPTHEPAVEQEINALPAPNFGQPPDQGSRPEITNQSEPHTIPSEPKAAASEINAGTSQPDSPRQIQTEIGPLPDDLWRLLGEEPPTQEGDTAPAPTTGTTQAGQPRLESIPDMHTTSGMDPDPDPYLDKTSTRTLPKSPASPPLAGSVPAETGVFSTDNRFSAGTLQRSHEKPQHPDIQQAALPTYQDAALQQAIAVAESKPAQSKTHSSHPPLSQDAQPGPVKDILPPIQRQPASGSAARANTGGSSQEADSGQQTQSDLDLDELARQVYGQLRRRLEIDIERLHRR